MAITITVTITLTIITILLTFSSIAITIVIMISTVVAAYSRVDRRTGSSAPPKWAAFQARQPAKRPQ